MLDKIRERIRGPIAIAILLLIGVPLVITFANMDAGTPTDRFAARVNGTEIPSLDFQRVYQNRLVDEQEAAGGTVSAEAEAQLRQVVIDGLVMNQVVAQYVDDAGYRVSDEQLATHIRSLPAFKVGGEFSRPAYEAALVGQGISTTRFENDQRAALAVTQLQEGLADSAFYTPAEYRRLIELQGERRAADYVLLDPRQLGADMQISDADLKVYYDANAAQFRSPESVTLEYIELGLDDMARDYQPDEAALRAAYEADPTRFRTDEQRHARHILIAIDGDTDAQAAEKRAGEVATQLAAGADFAELAAKYSDDAGSAKLGGDLGMSSPGAFMKPFEDALYRLSVGETSPPVRTDSGFHIIRLEAVRPGSERSFAEVRDELARELREKKAQDEFYALAERVDDLALENPSSLEPVARETGLAVRRIEGFTRSGGGPFRDTPKLVSAVFSAAVLEDGENTPLVQIDDTHAVVARVAEHHAPAPMPFEAVRAQITERVRALRATTMAQTVGEAILERTGRGETLAAAAAAEGQQVSRSEVITRRSPTLPEDLSEAIFRAPRPAAQGGPVIRGLPLAGGGYAVFALRSATPGAPDDLPAAQREQQKRAMAEQTAIIETEALAANLRSEADVIIAPDVLKSAEEP